MKIIRDEQKFTITDFVWENKYSYGNYFRDDDNGPRTYKVGEKKVPSVTTILNATQSPEKKASLDAWRERVGHQEAQRIMVDASTRGTEMHYVLEQYINGKGYFNLSKKGAQARLMAHRLIEDGLGPLTKVFGSEVNLAYEDQWAGSTDLVAIYGALNISMDSTKPAYIREYAKMSLEGLDEINKEALFKGDRDVVDVEKVVKKFNYN